ncbi:transmembrane protein, putative (macronuclear) [Tetrahymena thermophila SB210]|uniref:Transmembrane protein, putative n=1 Tax=Tetrahymena thermophila (strain SB210) TaxID=312017 RepID=W7XJU5_TETTS|nr:transmembrane protein, putative [Tetrahymena thermophila SB210]EWS74339.1 transmembrane protein, putative [Tetrahymena thermophila SB210]|eukprot:XP_012653160.1 transmembrane protein, putative [Tetrahymena thermophila SB210]
MRLKCQKFDDIENQQQINDLFQQRILFEEIQLQLENQYADGQQCPQTTIQTNAAFYGSYTFNNYLKLPKTNILLAISVQYSGKQVAHTTVYLDDISTTQDNVLEVVRTEYQILQLDYIEPLKKIIVSNQSYVLIIDPFSIKPIKQIDYRQVIGMSYIKDFGLIFMCSGVCECYVVEINSFKTLFRFNHCQYDSNPFIQNIFSKAYKQNNGVVLLVVQDSIGLCTWSYQYRKGIYQYNYHLQLEDGFLNSSHNYDSHDQYDILFLAGNNTVLKVYNICHFCKNQPYIQLFNQTITKTNTQFYNIKFIRVNISGQEQQSIFISDLYILYRLDFQVITDPSTNQVQSLNFLNLQNPFQVQLVGIQIYYAFLYHNSDNQQLLIPVYDSDDDQKSFTFVYNYNTNTSQIRLYYRTNGFTKQFRIYLQQNYYFVSLFDSKILITQDSIQGNIIQQFNIRNSPYVGNSFFSVYNNPLCYIIIQVGHIIKFYKTSLDNLNSFAHYLSLDYLSLNIPSEILKPVAFYQKNNNQDQVWVVLSLPIKKNNQKFLFHIIDMWNFQFQVLVSNNPDDNINQTSFALYCDYSQEIIGLDVIGNVYVWDAKNFTNFKYKSTITQYACLNPLTGTMRYDINGIYLIVECDDFQVISFNMISGQTQKIIKLSSIHDVLKFIEDIQLLFTYDFSSGTISIFKFQSGSFQLVMNMSTNQYQKYDYVVNFTYFPETQILWIQYFYANIYFEIVKCINDISSCMNCSMDFYFNTTETKQSNLIYGLGTIDSPFQTSSSLITAFYNAKKYQQLFSDVKNINLNIIIDPSNTFNLIEEFISIDFGSNISLNIKNLNSSQKGQINITNYIQFSNYNSLTLDNLLFNFNILTSANNSQQNCGIYLTNVQNSFLNNLDYTSQNSLINCFQIQINNSTTTISNIILANKDLSNTNQIVTIDKSNQIYFRNFQLLNSTLNSQLSILNQISDTQLFIDNMIIQNNNCSSYYVNPPEQVGQLFQVGQSQVTNLLIANNSFCNQKIFSTNGNINQKNLEFIFQNITIQQNKFYIQAQYLFFDSIYYFNSVPQHSLYVSNVFSSDNSYFSQIQGQQAVIETSSLFFTNQIKNITLQNVTVYNQYEISFCIVQFSNFVNLYNLTYQNDKVFYDRRNNIKFGGFIQFSEIQQFNLKLMKVSNIRARDNSIMSITTQQYSNINMTIQNVEIYNCQFNQTKSNSPANPIYISSQYYSNISIYQCSFHDNLLIGLINSQIQSTTALQIVSPLGDTSILETQFTNSKSNSIYNFVYLQSNQIFINQCNFKNSSFDFQDPISQFKQEGGSIRAKFNNLVINGTQFVNSTANQGAFMYLESLSNDLNIQLNQTSFVQGYSNFQGSVLYIDNSNSDLFFKCSQCNFTEIYSFNKDSEAISIKYTDTQTSSKKNTILIIQAYLTNILGLQNNFFINSANSITQFQNIQQTQTQNFTFPQQFTNQIQNLQSQALVQSQNSNITISKSLFSNLYNLPNQISPLFINSTSSNINMTDIVFQYSKFSKSLINFGIGQLIIQKSQFLNNTQVYQTRFLQSLKPNLPYQNNSLILIENSQLQISDHTLFEHIQCYQNCYGSSIYMANSTFQIDQTKFIYSKAIGGGAIFIESLRSIENQISNCYFMGNQAKQDGGALYIHGNKEDQFQLKIFLTVFNDNLSQQGSGGAIFITSDSNNSTQQQILIKNSILQNNQAQIGGAIQNFGINPFYDSNTIQNNKASLYGSNTFSYPTSLFLTNEVQFNKQQNQSTKLIVLNDFKSGGNLPNFIFQLRDDRNITVIQQKDQLLTSKIQVSNRTKNSIQYYIRGNSEINIDPTQHNFNFSNLQLIGLPESSAVIQFTSDSIKIYNPITSQYDSNYTFDVFVNFRSCLIGEIINKYNNFQECQTCENGKYSLDYTSCYPCPDGGICQNGVIQLVQGFWREESNSSDIIECTNRKENCIGKTFGNYVCITGNIGPLCEECDIYGQFWGESFTRINKYQCTQCKDSQQNLWKLFLSVSWIFFSLQMTLKYDRDYQISKILIQVITRKRQNSSSNLSHLLNQILVQKSYIKIFTNYIQIISFVTSFNLAIKSDLLEITSTIGVPISSSVDYFDCLLRYSSSKIPMIYLNQIQFHK